VSGHGIKHVTFAVDNRSVKTLTRPNVGRTGWRYTAVISHTRYGRHLLALHYVDACDGGRAASTIFARVAAIRTIVPRFTG
jgi:hypothetical protein